MFTNDPKVPRLRLEVKVLLDAIDALENKTPMVTFTKEHLEAGKSSNGAWSAKQLRLLKVNHKKHGWKRRAIGRKYPADVVERFVALKDKHLISGKSAMAWKLAERAERNSLDVEFIYVTAGL